MANKQKHTEAQILKMREQTAAWRKAHPGKVKEAAKAWQRNNVERNADNKRTWRKQNPERNATNIARWRKQNAVYVTTYRSIYHHKVTEQLAGRPRPKYCEVCRETSNKALCFDHDHKTGLFRGWLCHRCNFVLSYTNDTTKILLALANYLTKPKGSYVHHYASLSAKESLAGRAKPKRCEVCKKTGRRIHFDHCHKSNRFRGWICHQCNVALGHVRDNQKLLRKLADYLEKSK